MDAQAWLSDPLQYLSRFKLPRTIAEAEEYLSWRLQTATLLWICAHYQPGKLPLHLAREQDLLLPTREVLWSEGEYACQHLIAWEVIPYDEEGPEMMVLEEGERAEYLQPLPMGMDHWTNGFVGEYNQGWLMLGLLDREANASDMDGLPEVCRKALSHAHPYRGIAWSDEDMVAACRREGPPYNALPTAIHLLDHSTDNLFLDPTPEAPLDPVSWGDREGLEYLIGAWQQAQEMQGWAEQFTEYLAAHPGCLRKVVDLWNLGLWNMAMR